MCTLWWQTLATWDPPLSTQRCTNVLHCICVIQSATRNRKTFLRPVRSFNIVCAYLSFIEIFTTLEFHLSKIRCFLSEGLRVCVFGCDGIFPEVLAPCDSYYADKCRKSLSLSPCLAGGHVLLANQWFPQNIRVLTMSIFKVNFARKI